MFLLSAIIFAILLSSSAAEESRKPKLFFVSSSSTTSTLSTASLCWTSATGTTVTACGKRKKRMIAEDKTSDELPVAPSAPQRIEDIQSGMEVDTEAERQGKFLLYWKTTTLTSTSTSYTTTLTLKTIECTPTGFGLTVCGK